jgi:hypothetical protein
MIVEKRKRLAKKYRGSIQMQEQLEMFEAYHRELYKNRIV